MKHIQVSYIHAYTYLCILEFKRVCVCICAYVCECECECARACAMQMQVRVPCCLLLYMHTVLVGMCMCAATMQRGTVFASVMRALPGARYDQLQAAWRRLSAASHCQLQLRLIGMCL